MQFRDRWEDVLADIARALGQRYLDVKERERAELARKKAKAAQTESESLTKLETRPQTISEKISSEDDSPEYYPDYEGEDLEDGDD